VLTNLASYRNSVTVFELNLNPPGNVENFEILHEIEVRFQKWIKQLRCRNFQVFELYQETYIKFSWDYIFFKTAVIAHNLAEHIFHLAHSASNAKLFSLPVKV
jgi:hypothetical protein